MEDNNEKEQEVKEASTKDIKPYSNLMIYIPVGVFVVLIIVIGIVFMRRGSGDGQMTTEQKDEQTIFREGGLAERKNEILIKKYSKGDIVTVDYALLEMPGYIVIHDEVDGKPGNIIGSSSILFGGEAENIDIKLDREMITGEVLFAILHKDNGDGKFSFPGDEPVNDVNRNIIMSMFKVTEAESVKAEELANSDETGP